MDQQDIAKAYYQQNLANWQQVGDQIQRKIENCLSQQIEKFTIKYRIKTENSFCQKFMQKKKAQSDYRVEAIADAVGFRIICPFLDDLRLVEKAIRRDFSVVEIERKGMQNSFKEFSYESVHLLVHWYLDGHTAALANQIVMAEIQIRTILQDAWAEVEHEIIYKSNSKPYNEPLKRKLAALNANLTLSDILFQEIRDYQKELQQKIQQRRELFDEQISTMVLSNSWNHSEIFEEDTVFSNGSEDNLNDLLLHSLNAHHDKKYARAIAMYDKIVNLSPDDHIKSIVFTHRGMAHFSLARYEQAIEDFSSAFSIDENNLRCLYCRGVAYQVQKKYDQALQDLNLCIKKDPLYFDAIFSRAQIFFHLHDYAQAIVECESALSLQPEAEKAQKFLAMARHQAML